MKATKPTPKPRQRKPTADDIRKYATWQVLSDGEVAQAERMEAEQLTQTQKGKR